MTSNNWIADAPCALPVPTDDSEKPRPLDFYSESPEEQERAKAVCAECPFRLQCLQLALDNHERWGIHGGVDEVELRRAQAINELGESFVSKAGPIRCPNCQTDTKDLIILERKRTRTHIECTGCGTDWVARKGINTKGSNW